MTALYVVAGILAALALTALGYLFVIGILGLIPRPDPEPPAWVNDGRPHHGRCRRGAWREDCTR